ncbi:MAG: hypothetical protein Q8M24_04515 [Pseudolabrys sp.]|nr:hypothetical protein [Pseudolabrys sp.]
MVDYFSDPRRRLARAKENIANLNAGIRAFTSKNPYSNIIDVDPQTQNKIHKVVLTDPIPDELFDLADEIVEALRSVLDKIGFAAASTLGATKLNSTYFPIADTDDDLKNGVLGRGRCRDLPEDIVQLFLSFNPTKSGNILIWAINQLANSANTAFWPLRE